MGASKDLFLKISEEDFLRIPQEIRESHLNSKVFSESLNDFDELMQNPDFERIYSNHKRAKKEMEEMTFYLREKKRSGK